MNNRLRVIFLALSFTACGWASAQQATEVYIPIGESPGVTANSSVTGEIKSVDYSDHRMTIEGSDGSRIVKITPRTLFYLDRNSDKKQNEAGSFEDCETGRYVEVFVDAEGNARWVKIAAR